MALRRRSAFIARAATEMLARSTKLITYNTNSRGNSRRAALPRALCVGLAAIVATCGSFRGPVEQLHHEMTPTRSL